MPWTPADATRHTRKVATPKQQGMSSAIGNRLLGEGSSDGEAIRIANGVVKKRAGKAKAKAKRRK